MANYTCPNCRGRVSDTDRSCPTCGTPIAEIIGEEKAAKMRTPEKTAVETTVTAPAVMDAKTAKAEARAAKEEAKRTKAAEKKAARAKASKAHAREAREAERKAEGSNGGMKFLLIFLILVAIGIIVFLILKATSSDDLVDKVRDLAVSSVQAKDDGYVSATGDFDMPPSQTNLIISSGGATQRPAYEQPVSRNSATEEPVSRNSATEEPVSRKSATEEPRQVNYCATYGHSSSENVTRTADCSREGEKVLTCSRCGYRETQSIPKDPYNHNGYGTYISGKRDATCTSNGYSGDEYCYGCYTRVRSGHTIASTGHSWKAATYSAPETCRNCGTTRGKKLESTPQKDSGNYMIVTSCKGVNVRSQKSGNSNRLGHLDQGEIITYTGDFRYTSGGDAWVQISYNGSTGYVNTNTTSMPFVVRFSEHYSGSGRKISVRNGAKLYLLPDGNTQKSNQVGEANSGRQYTCVGTVKSVSGSATYYVVKCDSGCKYKEDGKEFAIRYAFIMDKDVK